MGRNEHIAKAKNRSQWEKVVEILHSFIHQGGVPQHGLRQALDIQVRLGETTLCGASDGTSGKDKNERKHHRVSGQSSVQFTWKQER